MKRFLLFLLVAALGLVAACSGTGSDEGEHLANQPPTVWLSAGPPEGSTGKYRVQMFWGGWDPDGEIAGYEYLVTDNATGVFNPADTVDVPWTPVAGNDSTFTFTADEKGDSISLQIWTFSRSHTFFIRSIDQEGLRSREPAHRSFTSRTLSPEVAIQIPVRNALNPARVPSISTFRWRATDWVDDMLVPQEPESVQWALVNTIDHGGLNAYNATLNYIRDYEASKDDWYPWVWYKAPQDSGKFWTTPVVDIGTYVFAIRAKDEAGAITPVIDELRNARRVKVESRTSGPLMTVNNEYIGVIRTTVCRSPLTILDSPAGVPLEFKISATADAYGGTVVGYRYGWDIVDLNNPEDWDIDITPFVGSIATIPARSFFFGTHTITMEVVDNNGYCSRVEVKVNVVQFTLERNLLVVDDDNGDEVPTSGWANGGIYPNDEEHDSFWRTMAEEVAGFDAELDMVDTKLGFVPLAKLAEYKSIIWSVQSDVNTVSEGLPLLYRYIAHRPKNPANQGSSGTGKVLPNVLALTMAAGGHIMVAGRHPVQLVVARVGAARNVKYPLIFLYELEGKQDGEPVLDPVVGDLSFAYKELCLETLDYAPPERNRGPQQYCLTEGLRPPLGPYIRDNGMRDALPLDPDFPTLTLRPEAAAPGQWYDPEVRGLSVEVYNPEYFRRGGACEFVPTAPRSCFQPIYGLGCFDTEEETYNQPIAFWTSAFADRVADVAGAVGARSVVFGFPPVFISESDFRPVMDRVLFDEWKLPKNAGAAVMGAR